MLAKLDKLYRKVSELHKLYTLAELAECIQNIGRIIYIM